MSSIFGRMSTAILRHPSGRYGIVGSVPAELTEMRRGVAQSRVWDTEEAAIEALLSIGCTKFQRADCSWYQPTPIEEFAVALNTQPKLAEVPFSLTAPPSRAPRGKQESLFSEEV